MTGLSDTDIKLDENWQLTQSASGDAPLASGLDCLLQNIRLEAITQEGDLFCDMEFGWSLLEFVHREHDELLETEITMRVKRKLEQREIIDPDTINISVYYGDDALTIFASFRFFGSTEAASVTATVDRVKVEVIAE